MAALPYIQFYVADYLADTAHLTTEEHGAYLLLIFSYWQTGKPLRKDRLATVARMSNDRWNCVERVLSEFFHDNGEAWVHFRIEADLAGVQEAVDKASRAGKASALARQRKKELKDNARSTSVQQTSNECSTDVPTKTQPSDQIRSDQNKSDKPARQKASPVTVSADDMREDFPELTDQTITDYLALRKTKKAPLSMTAWGIIVSEIKKTGLSGEQALKTAIFRGWQGFNAEWITKHPGKQPDPPPKQRKMMPIPGRPNNG